MIDDVVFLADQLVGLLLILDDGAAHLGILTQQLFAGQVLDDAGPQRVPQDVGGGPQAVATEAWEKYIRWSDTREGVSIDPVKS